jgi:hypothetical protein
MTSYEKRLVCAIALAVALLFNAEVAGAQLKCRPADSITVQLVAQFQQWMNTTNPERIAQRDTLFHIPVVASTAITVVTDEKICAKMITAYSTTSRLPYTPTRLYVLKLGSKGYAGYDLGHGTGEFSSVSIFSTKYVWIGGWSG